MCLLSPIIFLLPFVLSLSKTPPFCSIFCSICLSRFSSSVSLPLALSHLSVAGLLARVNEVEEWKKELPLLLRNSPSLLSSLASLSLIHTLYLTLSRSDYLIKGTSFGFSLLNFTSEMDPF